jgi:hypothetical protein
LKTKNDKNASPYLVKEDKGQVIVHIGELGPLPVFVAIVGVPKGAKGVKRRSIWKNDDAEQGQRPPEMGGPLPLSSQEQLFSSEEPGKKQEETELSFCSSKKTRKKSLVFLLI